MNKNQIRYIAGVICMSSAVDQSTQALSIFNMLDQVTIDLKGKDALVKSPEKINIPIQFQVISVWKRKNPSESLNKVDSKVEVEFLDPIGTSLHKTVIDLPIPEKIERSRNILNVNGMPVTRTGEYTIQFKEITGKEKNDVLGSMTFDIIVKRS